MTMQIGVVAKRGIVLASDTKHRTTEKQQTGDPLSIPSGIINCSKISLCERHDIAIALAGWSDLDASVGKDLADHLDSLQAITNDDIGGILMRWGDSYYAQSRLAGAQSFTPLASLLVVRPAARYPLLKLRVNYKSNVLPSEKYLVNGNESNTAIFWPEYLKVYDELYDLDAATMIAATTILMGAKLNDPGVGGLEIWQYTDQWKPVPPEEIEALRVRFDLLQRGIRKAIHLRSKRDRLAPPPSRE